MCENTENDWAARADLAWNGWNAKKPRSWPNVESVCIEGTDRKRMFVHV